MASFAVLQIFWHYFVFVLVVVVVCVRTCTRARVCLSVIFMLFDLLIDLRLKLAQCSWRRRTRRYAMTRQQSGQERETGILLLFTIVIYSSTIPGQWPRVLEYN